LGFANGRQKSNFLRDIVKVNIVGPAMDCIQILSPKEIGLILRRAAVRLFIMNTRSAVAKRPRTFTALVFEDAGLRETRGLSSVCWDGQEGGVWLAMNY